VTTSTEAYRAVLAVLACHFPATALVKYDLDGGRLRSFPYYLGFEDGLAGEDYEHPLDFPALELFDASGKPATEAEAQSELRAVTSEGEVRMDMANISSSFYLNMKDEAGARAACAKLVRSFDNLKAEEASARQALDEFPGLQARLSELVTGPGIVFARWVAELVDSNVVLKWIFLLRSDEDAIFSSTPPRQYCELDEVTRGVADAVMQRDGGFMRLPPNGIHAEEADYDIPGLKQRVYELVKKSKPDEELMTSARLMAEAAEAALRAMDQLCAEGRKEAIAADALEALHGAGSKAGDREGAVPSDQLLGAKGTKMTSSCLLRFSSQSGNITVGRCPSSFEDPELWCTCPGGDSCLNTYCSHAPPKTCGVGFHTKCLGAFLPKTTPEDWRCPFCAGSISSSAQAKQFQAMQELHRSLRPFSTRKLKDRRSL